MTTHLLPKRRPRHTLTRGMGLASVTLLSAALLAWTPTVVSGWNQSTAETKLWQLTNADRSNNGVRPLQQNSTLIGLARWRSKDMIVNDYFSHNIPACGGCMVFHYYDTNGLQYSWGGENIGWNNGYTDAESPIAINDAFMKSADHRANILEPKFTHGGVGAYAANNIVWGGVLRSPRMYTELFMQAKAAAPPPPPPAPKPTPKPAPKPTPVPVPPAPAAATQAPTPAPAAPTATPAATASPTPNIPEGPEASSSPFARPDPTDRDPQERTPLATGTTGNDLTGYRIEAAPPADTGLFETILAGLLGFSLG